MTLANAPFQHIETYLRERHINYTKMVDEEDPCIFMALSGYPNCPSERIEISIYNFDKLHAIKACVYYAHPAPEILRESQHLDQLYQFLNFLNTNVWPYNQDGADNLVYDPSYLLAPRFYLTEAGDIMASVIMEKALFFAAPLEIEDFLTICVPGLLNELSFYIFGVAIGKMQLDDAIAQIKKSILHIDD